MKTFLYEYVTLKDYCDHYKLDYNQVIDAVSQSDVSFGNNYDTLISCEMLVDILNDFDIVVPYDIDKVLISLGS